MQFLVIVVLSLLMFLAATTRNVQQAIDAPAAVAEARVQVEQYRMFVYVAGLYMQGYSGGAATIPWTTLRGASGVPSGVRNAGMPATWRVVAAADNSWVACTEMDERAVAAVQQMATLGGRDLIQASSGSTNYMVVGGAADTGKASQCN